MKKLFICGLLFMITNTFIGQILEPAKWYSKYHKYENGDGDNIIELIFDVNLDNTWQLYSNIQNYDIGPLPASFVFETNDGYELIGDVEPIGSKTKHEPVFDVDVKYFEGRAEFRQKVKVLKPNPVIEGTVNYQVCTTVDGKCINLEEDFEFRIKTIE